MLKPNPSTWKKHTAQAAKRGLSSGALACLGTQPRAVADNESFTGYFGVVTVISKPDVIQAGQLAAAAIGTGRGVLARKNGAQWTLRVPLSKRAATELTPSKRKPNDAPAAAGMRSRGYDAAMRPTTRARIKARAIMQEQPL